MNRLRNGKKKMSNESITNRDVLLNKLQLFTHSPGYQTPQNFVGRTRETEVLVKQMIDQAPKVVTLSDLLGSGKSFLIEMSLHEAGIKDIVKPVLIRNVDEPKLRSTKYPFIIIDDIDVRNPYNVIEMKLGIVNKLINETNKPVFLIGDYTLRNEKVLSIFTSIQKREQVKMEQLGKKLLIDALNQRATKELKKPISIELFEPDVLNYLLPNTTPGVATFREVLTYLDKIAGELPPINEKCLISSREVREWLKKEIVHFPNEYTKQFYQFIIKYIRENYTPEKEMQAIETSRFKEMYPIQGINTDDEYEEKILKPFTEKGILKSFGIPFLKDTNFSSRFAGPYLPTIKTFLEAKFGGD
jgi:hypothetical protein